MASEYAGANKKMDKEQLKKHILDQALEKEINWKGIWKKSCYTTN